MEHLLKQLKHLKPDEAYTLRSRNVILETLPADEVPVLTPWRVFTHSLQFGSSIAMVGIFLILVFGGFSTWSFLSPFRLTSLDPASLRAEAEAVDIQLEIANIRYAPVAKTAPSPTAMSIAAEPSEPAPLKENEAAIKAQAETEAKNLGILPASSSQSEATVDDVLEELAQ
jgi:hypothetical protein